MTIMSKLKIRSHEEISDFEKLTITDFSYSRLDTYKMCAAKYFYSYIQKEPRTFNEPAVMRKHNTLCIRKLC